MNWRKLLHNAWRDLYAKKRKKGEHISPYIKSFSDNSKKRLSVIERQLCQRTYKFGTWKATLKPKNDGSFRPIINPFPIGDKLVLKAITNYLSQSLKSIFNSVDSISYAYQKGKSTREALLRLKKIHNPKHVLLKIDIKHFFDEIDKAIITQLLEQYQIDDYIQDLISKSINPTIDYSNIEANNIELFPKGGIPQGNSISSLLSNLYLYELDKMAIAKGWKMIRYADDMVFSVCDIEEAKLILSQVEKYLLDNRKLTIHSFNEDINGKTTIIANPKKTPMKYLGVMFDGQHLFPAKDCYWCLVKRIKTILKCALSAKEKEMAIKKVISQWCGYYAFTDIPSSKINNLNNILNYQVNKYHLKMSKINVADVIAKTRQRQNNLFTKLFHTKRFGEEEYSWLAIYD